MFVVVGGVCVCVLCLCAQVCVYVCVYVSVHVCVNVFKCTCIYMSTFVKCTCVYTHKVPVVRGSCISTIAHTTTSMSLQAQSLMFPLWCHCGDVIHKVWEQSLNFNVLWMGCLKPPWQVHLLARTYPL